jgi:hypothetical protein
VLGVYVRFGRLLCFGSGRLILLFGLGAVLHLFGS